MTTATSCPADGEIIKPLVSEEQAIGLVEQLYGIPVTKVSPLNSYDDRNFKVTTQPVQGKEECFVLKIANIRDSQKSTFLDIQNKILLHLKDFQGAAVQKVVKSVNGKYLEMHPFNTPINIAGEMQVREHAVRLLTFIPGSLLLDAPLTPALCRQLGTMTAKLDIALNSFDAELSSSLQPSDWNLRNIPDLLNFVYAIEGRARQDLIRDVVRVFGEQISPIEDTLAKGVIHGDLNDQNILVNFDSNSSQWNVAGILDWQDISMSHPIFELAILIMYCMFCKRVESFSLYEVGTELTRAYVQVKPLEMRELKLLPVLVAARFAQSLCLGEYTYRIIDNTNPYLIMTAKEGWEILEKLWLTERSVFEYNWLKDLSL